MATKTLVSEMLPLGDSVRHQVSIFRRPVEPRCLYMNVRHFRMYAAPPPPPSSFLKKQPKPIEEKMVKQRLMSNFRLHEAPHTGVIDASDLHLQTSHSSGITESVIPRNLRYLYNTALAYCIP